MKLRKMKTFLFLTLIVLVAVAVAHSDNDHDELLPQEPKDEVRRQRQEKKKTLRRKKYKSRKKGRSRKLKNKKKRKMKERNQKKKKIKGNKLIKKWGFAGGATDDWYNRNQRQGEDPCFDKFRSFDLELVQTNLRKDIKVASNNDIMNKKRAKVK